MQDNSTDNSLIMPNPNSFVPFVGGISFLAGIIAIAIIMIVIFHHLKNK